LALAIAAMAAMAATSGAASASGTVDVYVGYADSLRAAPTNFPTPWAGSPGMTFEGCQPAAACVYDAGAVRIVNNTGSPVTVNSVAVHVSTCTYTGWPSASLAPGGQLVVTQLGSGAADGCTGPVPAVMDTSDIGPNGSPYAGNCTPDGIQPTVDVTVDGTPTTYTDSGQVLNTGGVDRASCPSGTNESTQWTLVGHAPCAGSDLTLAPSSQTVAVFSPATVTATFENSCGEPLSGALVKFTVVSGPNAGTTGTGVTNSSGQASFTYTSVRTGTDTLVATITNPAGTITSNQVTVTWVIPPPSPLCAIDITQGGWMIANNGDKVSFGGVAHTDQAGRPSGEEQYTDSPASLDVHSIKILAVTCSANLEEADIYGTATENGTGTHLFRIQVTDPDSSGGHDTYWIRLDNYDSGSHPLGGGTVEIHHT
jgi:hypothetical protein